MKKIGILTCLNSNDVCTRAGCLSAFRERRDFFSGYPEDTILAAVMTCNGCKETNAKEPAEDEGILEKADRLVSEKISVIHVDYVKRAGQGFTPVQGFDFYQTPTGAFVPHKT